MVCAWGEGVVSLRDGGGGWWMIAGGGRCSLDGALV